jgi:predicted transcriptional regulator of viral defense system
LTGDRNPENVQRQLSRWSSAGKVVQLKRGLYALAEPYRKVTPHPFLIANHLVRGSYVSLQSALAYYGMIPEHVPLTLSMTTRTPSMWENPLGEYQFHHIIKDLFAGYQRLEVVAEQQVFIALPEKALLDLVHLTPGGDVPDFLESLRLQNLERLDENALYTFAGERPKLKRAAERIVRLAHTEVAGYETP